MTTQEIKTKVAELLRSQAIAHAAVFKYNQGEPTQDQREAFIAFKKETEEQIESLIPESEKLSIVLTGCAKGELSHYDIQDTLKQEFKPGEGIQYDSEGGQFWVYVRPDLVQKVLRRIDYFYPGQLDLNVSTNRYADNPWFQNWTQAERYLLALGI